MVKWGSVAAVMIQMHFKMYVANMHRLKKKMGWDTSLRGRPRIIENITKYLRRYYTFIMLEVCFQRWANLSSALIVSISSIFSLSMLASRLFPVI